MVPELFFFKKLNSMPNEEALRYSIVSAMKVAMYIELPV